MLEKIYKVIGALLVAAVLFVLINGSINSLSIYSPKFEEHLDVTTLNDKAKAELEDSVKILTFHTSHAALGSEGDLKAEGGSTGRADTDVVLKNARGIAELINLSKAEIVLLQDVDIDSYRSRWVDEVAYYSQSGNFNFSYAVNRKLKSTSFLPPYKKLVSGALTLSRAQIISSKRVSLPSFKEKNSQPRLQSSMLISEFSVKGGKKLFVINFELGKYLKTAEHKEQVSALMAYAQTLYESGHYVLLGGSFNRQIESTLARYPLSERNAFKPKTLYVNEIPSGWSICYDDAVPTARILNAPFDRNAEEKQVYVSDGFILSPNLSSKVTVTVDQSFEYSAHNPVLLEITFK